MSSYLFSGFTYLSNLTDEVESDLPELLRLDPKTSTEAILLRLLLGTLDFKVEEFEGIYNQKICYSKVADRFNDRSSPNPITDWTAAEFGISDLEFYFSRNKRNKALFDELLVEFSLYFLYKNKGNFSTAFLHLYRALEYMSYSFPLTYSSKTTGFYSTYDTFKGFFLNKEQGQLKFFREFIHSLFEKSLLRCRVKIDTYVGDELYDKKKLRIIKKICDDFSHTDNGTIVEFEYEYMLDFMISLRNRYFHFQSDRSENISNLNFDSELFFESLNDQFANWLSMIYLEVATQGIYKICLLPR